ncbi:hypothetical protein [Vibrio metschnikovii]|uniref:hypothetical protein n=1 Tax=Vibrio metschnikovii TaxID=28172 RepID=UPI002FC7CDDD
MRTAINTCLTLLILMMIFLSSLAFASDAACPIGINRMFVFPPTHYLGTSDICYHDCLYHEGYNGNTTYQCNQTECFGIYISTGNHCSTEDAISKGSWDCSGSTCVRDESGNTPPPSSEDNGDVDYRETQMPSTVKLGTAGFSTTLAQGLRGIVENNREFANKALQREAISTNRVVGSIEQLTSAINTNQNRPVDLSEINTLLTQQNEILTSIKNSNSNGSDDGSDDGSDGSIASLLGSPSDMSTNPVSLFGAIDHLWSIENSQLSQLNSITNNTSSMGSALDNLYGISASADSSSNSLRGILQILSDQQHSDDGINAQMYENMVLYLENAIKTQTDSISGSVSGLGSDIEGIKGALTTKFDERAFVGKVDFDVHGVLYKSSLYNDLFIEREQLENEYEQLLDKVKNMFSFDTSDLNSGEYKDHILDFLAPDGSGRQFSFKSGVFPAFIQQANLIATILLFIAAVIAVRVIMGGSK